MVEYTLEEEGLNELLVYVIGVVGCVPNLIYFPHFLCCGALG